MPAVNRNPFHSLSKKKDMLKTVSFYHFEVMMLIPDIRKCHFFIKRYEEKKKKKPQQHQAFQRKKMQPGGDRL